MVVCPRSLSILFLVLVAAGCFVPTTLSSELSCEELSRIQVVPFSRNGTGQDSIYRSFISASKNANTCLLEQLSNVALMPDPRTAPTYASFAVGDIAHILLSRINDIDFEMALPSEVQVRYREAGVYAYFQFVSEPENRNLLRRNWKKLLNVEPLSNDNSDDS